MTTEQRARESAYQKQYRQDHKPSAAAYQEQYRQGHKVERVAYDKQFYQDHRAEKIIQQKQYDQNHKVEKAAYLKQYYQDHKPEAAARQRERKATDINFKLKANVTNKIGQSIKGTRQYRHSIDLLGCTIPEVREHLERQFQPGMTWDNWSLHGWHIDHIIPLEYFDFTDYEQQKRAWHYTNLQPLWAGENRAKSDNIIEKQLILM